MPKIKIACPRCSTKGEIEVDEERIKKVERGLLAINVAANTACACEHSFIIYLDKNLKIRDYFMADFEIQVPQSKKDLATTKNESTTELLSVDTLKMNLTPITISYVLKAILRKKKVVLILEHEFLFKHIIKFFEFITQNTFDVDLEILTLKDYMDNKKKYKNYIIIGKNEILKDKKKVIDPLKVKVEKEIVIKFMDETELMSSLIILKNELNKAYSLSQYLIEFIENRDLKKDFTSKILIESVKEAKNVKITADYLDFLLEIVENYFEVEVPSRSDVSDFLGLI